MIQGQTALITGASSGIGKACAEHFAKLGVNVVLAARRLDRIQAFSKELEDKYKINATSVKLDVQKHEQVKKVHHELVAQGIEVDILVNNAGLALATDLLHEAKVENWEIMIDTNLKGLLYVTRAFLPDMIKRNKGHVINIGSVAGHGSYMTGNVYSATKHAVRSISKSLRLDLMGTSIRVSEVAPGMVETEFSEVRWGDKEKAKKFYQGFEPLRADDISDAVIYCATRPPHVNVAELVVFPQAQASITDVYKGQPVQNVFNSK